MFNLGMGEITVILLLALIFLGPSKLPDLAAGLGKLIREIRKATSDVKNEIALDDTSKVEAWAEDAAGNVEANHHVR